MFYSKFDCSVLTHIRIFLKVSKHNSHSYLSSLQATQHIFHSQRGHLNMHSKHLHDELTSHTGLLFAVVILWKPYLLLGWKFLYNPYYIFASRLWLWNEYYTYDFERCPWCNGYRRRKWTQRHEFNSWTRLIAFHIALILLGKVWIQLFSLQLWVNSRTD